MSITKKEITPKKKKRPNLNSYDIQWENFIEDCRFRNLKQNSINNYIFYIGYFRSYLLRATMHSLLIDEITEEEIKKFLNHLKEMRKNRQSSINSAIRHLRPFFNYMFNKNLLPINPMAGIKQGKEDLKQIIPFSKEQIELLLKTPDRSTFAGFRDYCTLLILISTGARINEALNLKKGDLDFYEDSIIFTETKNRKPRIVGLDERVKKAIKKFINHYPIEDVDYLFQSSVGEDKLKIRSFQNNLKRYGKEAGIKGVRCSPHTFRNTFAINFLDNGGSTASLRQVLGHSSLITVERYLKWSDKQVINQTKLYSVINNIKIPF